MEGAIVIFVVIFLAIFILCVAAMWRIFEKAGQKGWKCIIPIYNVLVFLQIIGKPWWWIFLIGVSFTVGYSFMLSPSSGSSSPIAGFGCNILGYVFVIWSYNMLSKSFGKEPGFTAGLVFLGFIFLPILAFGDAKYLGPYGNKALFDAYQSNRKFDFEQNQMFGDTTPE